MGVKTEVEGKGYTRGRQRWRVKDTQGGEREVEGEGYTKGRQRLRVKDTRGGAQGNAEVEDKEVHKGDMHKGERVKDTQRSEGYTHKGIHR